MKKENVLTLLIALGLLFGAIAGELKFNPDLEQQERKAQVEMANTWGNLVFIRPLRMMIVPLVFISVVVGVTSIGDPQRLGLVGGATIVFYFSTMLLAVVVGLILVNIINPGASLAGAMGEALRAQGETQFAAQGITAESAGSIGEAFMGLLNQMLPENILAAANDGNTLAMVVAGILVGLALVVTGEKAKPAIAVFDGLFQAFLKLVLWIIWLAPLGIALIVTARVAEVGLRSLAQDTGLYVLTVILGLLFHMLVTLPAVCWFFGKANPYQYLVRMRKVLLTAFSTASSVATLPLTIEESQRVGGCSRRASNFVLPLGATINMDGTALYQGVAVMFLFQVYGFDMTLGQQLVIVVTATLAAAGTAAVPSAGLITMVIIIEAVNSSLRMAGGDGAATLPIAAIGLILGVDRILDMCRTAVNVWGDAVGARVMTRLAPDDAEQREAALG